MGVTCECGSARLVARGMCNNCYHRWRRSALTDAGLPPLSKPTCGVEGCTAPHHSKGWCDRHRRSFERYGDPLAVDKRRAARAARTCRIDGCERPARTLGMCRAHYIRSLRHGDPLAGRGPALRLIVAAHIADETKDRTNCWTHGHGCTTARPYIVVDGANVPVARYVLFLVNGSWPDTACHKCDNDKCWNPDHLYDGTQALNMDDAIRRERRVY